MDNLFMVFGRSVIYVYDDFALARARVRTEHKYVKTEDINKYIHIKQRQDDHFVVRVTYEGDIVR